MASKDQEIAAVVTELDTLIDQARDSLAALLAILRAGPPGPPPDLRGVKA